MVSGAPMLPVSDAETEACESEAEADAAEVEAKARATKQQMK